MTTEQSKLADCQFCKKPPGTKVGPPALARCVTPGCPGKERHAETISEWNTRAPSPDTRVREALEKFTAHYEPWIPASRFLTANSLETTWSGFVWMNPPFGGRNALVPWLEKFFDHANGIALTPDRTSAPWWQEFAPRADLILFVSPKLKFIGSDGRPGASPAQGTCLMARGIPGVLRLWHAASAGLGALMSPVSSQNKTLEGK